MPNSTDDGWWWKFPLTIVLIVAGVVSGFFMPVVLIMSVARYFGVH